jgi:hypothetical protein
MPGYSTSPLLKKLGIKPGFKLYVKNSPVDYQALVGKLPDQAAITSRLAKGMDFIHLFTHSKSELRDFLAKAKHSIKPDGMIWVSWPKKSAKLPTTVTEDVIRQVCLPMDLVDIKVCAIDDTWSGLKLVIRREKRNPT